VFGQELIGVGSQTVARALAESRAIGIDLLDAQLLLAHCLRRPRTWLLAHDDAWLDRGQYESFLGAAARRSRGEPLAYVVGEKEFCGLMLEVDRRVLIPRPETEQLVEWGLEALDRDLCGVPQPRIVDLGTGSGAIALAIKSSRPSVSVDAVDIDAESLSVARANAERLGLEVRFGPSDWWAALPLRAFHLALCNPPYVAAGDVHLAALGHEPRSALTPGPEGLEALRVVIEAAPQHLQAGGWLLLEHGFDQAEAVASRLHTRGFVDVQTRRDLAGLARCTGGCWAPN
jgi:release factor glutamine methyltransferase